MSRRKTLSEFLAGMSTAKLENMRWAIKAEIDKLEKEIALVEDALARKRGFDLERIRRWDAENSRLGGNTP